MASDWSCASKIPAVQQYLFYLPTISPLLDCTMKKLLMRFVEHKDELEEPKAIVFK